MDWMTTRMLAAIDLKRKFVAQHDIGLQRAITLIFASLMHGHKVLICGNGGSASDASHFAGELVGRYSTERMPMPAIALGSDPAVVTAISNDYGYEMVFDRQVAAFAQPGDVFVGISTSGNSKNVVNAAKRARSSGIATVGLMGTAACDLASYSDILLPAGTCVSGRAQEVHIFAIHLICEGIDIAWLRRKESSTR